jgi:hypothetical protein
MNKLYQALALAGLALLAACSRPQLNNADLAPINIAVPAELSAVAVSIKGALAEHSWKTLKDEPGHMVVRLSRQPFDLSVTMDIGYTPSQVTLKFLEMVSLDGEPITQLQIGHYHRWTNTLRRDIVDGLNSNLGRTTQAAY